MIDRTTKLRWRRRFKRSKRQVEDISVQAEEHLERHFIKRLTRLWQVKRFVFAWVLLLVLLIGGVIIQTRGLSRYYQEMQPVPGGSYTEGVLGTFSNASPLYATGSVDTTVSRLIFAGLFKYNQNNQLVGDLAESWSIDAKETTYTVKLRKNLTWQDGQPLKADDVVFTYQVIQNPDAKSPLQNSWKGVKIEKVDDYAIRFTLPNALSAFPNSMTNGIVPKHILANYPKNQLRSISFNSNRPVGAGPFKWDTLEVMGDTPETREQSIGLVPFANYHGGEPKLNRFVVRTFQDKKRLSDSFKNHELNAVIGLEKTPEEWAKDSAVVENSVPLTSATMIFFKMSQPPFDNQLVRQALVMATNTGEVIKNLGYPVVALKGPILKGQVGYNPQQTEFGFNPDKARQLLDQAGWKVGPDGIRLKDGKPLTFRLFSEDTDDYKNVTGTVSKQWRNVGVDVEVVLQPASDLQTTIAYHSYDSLLYGISIGADPDVFAYWHSSQADIRSPSRLNLSEYKSTVADKALEAGRTRSDPKIRAIKYKPFLDAWRNDAPAVALYQPRFLYITRGQIFGFAPKSINEGADRFSNVENWMIRQDKTTK